MCKILYAVIVFGDCSIARATLSQRKLRLMKRIGTSLVEQAASGLDLLSLRRPIVAG
jgi:hypothetical protein